MKTWELVLFVAAAVVFVLTKDRFDIRLRLIVLFGAIAVITLSGCAALPMPLQPVNREYNSNAAEISWLALDAVDTAQTMHLKPDTACAYEADPVARAIYSGHDPSPSRVLLTNIALATAHTMVTSWLDDRVAVEDRQREADDAYGVGPWLATRFVWHAVSLVASAHSVTSNYAHGCKL